MDVARGMSCLHAQRPPIIHRDLKTANLLVSARCVCVCVCVARARACVCLLACLSLTAYCVQPCVTHFSKFAGRTLVLPPATACRKHSRDRRGVDRLTPSSLSIYHTHTPAPTHTHTSGGSRSRWRTTHNTRSSPSNMSENSDAPLHYPMQVRGQSSRLWLVAHQGPCPAHQLARGAGGHGGVLCTRGAAGGAVYREVR